ncbi:MAG: hypothetical protein IPK28_18825 [Devosia sp.]|nr:hypothetical protein [Devosia sp.]
MPGASSPNAALELGFQKFVGLEVECASPTRWTCPRSWMQPSTSWTAIASSTFCRSRPPAPDRDRALPDGAALDPAPLRRDILAYAAGRGWVVPRCCGGDRRPRSASPTIRRAFWAERPLEVRRSGCGRRLFHPTTGCSLPDAVRVASLIAALAHRKRALAAILRRYSLKQVARQRSTGCSNRMLFRAAEPAERQVPAAVLPAALAPDRALLRAGRTSFADACRFLHPA